MSAGLRVGLDIGATKVLGAVVAAGGIVVAQAREVTVPGADGVLATATTVLDRLAAALDGGLPSHVGIGIPGIVDRDRGAVSHAVNLGLGSEWLPLADRLADRTGAVVVVENDLNAATWGAHVLSGADDLAYVSLGTGLAGRPRRPALLLRAARLPGAERRRLRPDRRLAGRRRDSAGGGSLCRRGRGKPGCGRGSRPLRRGGSGRDPDARPGG